MFNSLIDLMESSPLRSYIIIGCLLVMFAFLIWISLIDIKKQSITFWKMILASSTTIIMPFIASFFCGCGLLKWYLLGALVLWIFFLYINVKFNNDRFVGKADVDLLSALFSVNIMFSLWMYKVLDPNVVWIRITHAWYSFFLYLLIGAIFYVVLFLCIFIYKSIVKKMSLKKLIKETKVSVIPMLVPISIMVPYMIMVS